jgi:hypothetical protein
MLDEVGHRLPRIQVHHNLLPSKRLAHVTSELYAAVIDCFIETVHFFNKSTTRRFLSILSAPLESEFRETLARIERLSDLVEGDARAAAVASQHAITTTLILQLQEIKLITKHAIMSVREVKQLQTKALLQSVPPGLLHVSITT